MKVNVHIEVAAHVIHTEARLVYEGDLLLDVDKHFKIVPWYIRDARFVDVVHGKAEEPTINSGGVRMLQMEIGDPEKEDPNWQKKLFHPDEEVTVVRVR